MKLFGFDNLGNIARKGENAGNPAFSHNFAKAFLLKINNSLPHNPNF